MRKTRHIYWTAWVVVLVLLMTGCRFRDDEFVDFGNKVSGKGLRFQVIGQCETDLSGGLPDNCYLPDGTPVNEWTDDTGTPSAEPQHSADGRIERKTSSVTAPAILQELLKWGNQNQVIEIVGTYPSVNLDMDTIMLSGKVILPKGRRPKRLILVSHYTVCSNKEAPSNCFSLEGILAKSGYGLIIPDYLGYGVTANELHPYLVMDNAARTVIDMYLAVREWLDAAGMSPEEKEICLMGYSQGGATTMAVQSLIETEYHRSEDASKRIEIHRVFAGGGPYDVKATYERFVTTDVAGYPVAIPLVLQGMIRGNKLKVRLEDMMQGWLCDKIDEWINSKRYTSAQINALISTKKTHELLTDEAMDQVSDNVAELYKAMTANSILTYSWQPEAAVYMMHSMDDEVVPYTNATNAKAKWRDANIEYNFGHYGNHVLTALRFITSVQVLLDREEKERSEYEKQ